MLSEVLRMLPVSWVVLNMMKFMFACFSLFCFESGFYQMSCSQGCSAHLVKGKESETNWKPEKLNGGESWVLLCCQTNLCDNYK